MKGNMKSKIFLIVCFLVGLGIFIYPSLSDYVARRNVTQGAETYKKSVTELSQEDIDRMWAEAVQYNDSLNGDPVPDPFIPGSGRVLPENYVEVLNTGDGIMGYVEIDKIKVYLPIYHGASDEVLEKGAGHIEQTTLPIGGKGNLSVITAHTGFSGAEMFNRLIEIVEGDTFIIRILDRVLTYQVDDIGVIDPEDISKLLPTPEEDYVTLVTCTPYGINSHRLVVRGHRIENAPDAESEITQTPFPWRLVAMSAGAIIVFILILILNDVREKEVGK